MLPIVLTPQVAVGLAGVGEAFTARKALLEAAGIAPRLIAARIPEGAEVLGDLRVLFVAGLSETESSELARAARRAGVLVNVEDRPALCDFHLPAVVRRGDLLLTVSTAGRSPGLAAAVREHLEAMFGPEWEARLRESGVARARWRAQGRSAADVAERTRALITGKGWL